MVIATNNKQDKRKNDVSTMIFEIFKNFRGVDESVKEGKDEGIGAGVRGGPVEVGEVGGV